MRGGGGGGVKQFEEDFCGLVHSFGLFIYRFQFLISWESTLGSLWDIPHDRQSPGVRIQATARYIHVHGNPTVRCLVRLQQLLSRTDCYRNL
jgi:hypothetical protein